MEFQIRKRINAKNITEALEREKYADIVSVWLGNQEDYDSLPVLKNPVGYGRQ